MGTPKDGASLKAFTPRTDEVGRVREARGIRNACATGAVMVSSAIIFFQALEGPGPIFGVSLTMRDLADGWVCARETRASCGGARTSELHATHPAAGKPLADQCAQVAAFDRVLRGACKGSLNCGLAGPLAPGGIIGRRPPRRTTSARPCRSQGHRALNDYHGGRGAPPSYSIGLGKPMTWRHRSAGMTGPLIDQPVQQAVRSRLNELGHEA